MPASYTIRRSVPRNTRRSKPASTPSTCFPSFSINLFMAFPLPRGDLSSNTTNIIREQETPSPFGCGYAALCNNAETQNMIGDVLADSSAGATQHVFLLDTIDQCTFKEFPAVWTNRLREDLRGKNATVRARALALIRSQQLTGLDSELERIASSGL